MSRKFVKGYADPKGALVEVPGVGIMLATGTTKPTDATIGYSPGCIFIDTDAAAGSQFHVNEGTLASCTFKPTAMTGTELALLSGLLATAAEINRNNKVSTRLVTAITTLAVTQALHDGKTILLSLVTGFTSTLPAATGTGARFRFVVGIVNTSNNYIIITTGADVFKGFILTCSTTDTPDLAQPWISTAGTTITLNATTQGGLTIGDWVEVEDILTGVWAVRGMTTTSGAEATPFS